jgi:hypothetical protein
VKPVEEITDKNAVDSFVIETALKRILKKRI